MEEICPKQAREELESIMLNVSINIRELRKKNNATQNDIAYCIGSDKSVISAIETGATNNIKLFTLVKIATALGTDVVSLIS